MRKFRNAAIAGMTAITLVAGLNTAAFAETPGNSQEQIIKNGKPANQRQKFENQKQCTASDYKLDFDKVSLGDLNCETAPFTTDAQEFLKNPSNSSAFGRRYDANQDVYGTDLLGLRKNFDAQPVWSQIWYVVTALGVIGTVIGIGWLPVVNQLKAQGIII